MGRPEVNLLLDTHIWLWALLEPERLPASVRTALAAPTTRRWLSTLSVWEAMLLIERRRLSVDAEPQAWVRQALAEAPLEEAPITTEIVIASRALRTDHRDPVDRFLAATAMVFDLRLVTADRALQTMPGLDVMKVRPVGKASSRGRRV